MHLDDTWVHGFDEILVASTLFDTPQVISCMSGLQSRRGYIVEGQSVAASAPMEVVFQ
jgi:hypothetical protein